MYRGDRARKETLVEYGFRLPRRSTTGRSSSKSARSSVKQRIYVSATPGDYELEKTEGVVVEQVIRPTGLMDPEIYVRPSRVRSTISRRDPEARREGASASS